MMTKAVAVKKLGVVGLGVMGQAIIQGLIRARILKKEQIWGAARQEATCTKVAKELGITATPQYKDLLAETDVVLIAVKPKQVASVLDRLSQWELPTTSLVISIAAGVTLAQMEGRFHPETLPPIIRAMPNTPCIVGEGMTVLAAGQRTQEAHLALGHQLFESVGECVTLDEAHFDAVTALCGSGPAFLYTIMEALADGGVRVGLPRKAALSIVAQTVLGAAVMVQKTGRHPAALRDDVTTPAGCTIAGLLELEDGKIRSTLAKAVEQATATASQLGNG